MSMKGRQDGFYWWTKNVSRIILAPFFQLAVNGVDQLPETGAFVLLPKHQRWEDIPLLALASPRALYYVAKSELFNNPFIGYILRALGGLPLNRTRPVQSRSSLKSVIQVLEKGEGLVVFPEGTYYINKMGPPKRGIMRMVFSRISVPFIPVGIRYSRSGWRTKVSVRFGPPYHAVSGESLEDCVGCVMSDIAELSGLMP